MCGKEFLNDDVYQVEEIEAINFDEQGHESGTWNGYAVTKISDPANECFMMRDKLSADELCNHLNNISDISAPIMDDLMEWSMLVTKLSLAEDDLLHKKDEYQALSEELIKETDFKALYGKNNESIRKQHVKEELFDKYDELNVLGLNIDYYKRRISYLKELIRTKRAILEVKE